ncbi:hypothetical protein C9374_009239 [Naegleria lovaniensis]|uniref:Uncharacterized protein n=1 Tax=Naegleria lovaniensis TaxID=51637 RepID=A0AA88GF48_NAELO|nr:uncharacterized protein C9374_009239 [Naegleria lovaniensis]KAG2377328.1 hypothetical protein C9374_009239 [Naegleria lovaniensis]
MKSRKNFFISAAVCACFALLLCIAVTQAHPVVKKPPTPKPKHVDSYGDHKKYCYKKCIQYDSIKGKCSTYGWEGTTKRCVQYKTIGKGHCVEYKRDEKCLKWEGPSTICVAHGTRPECARTEKLTVCSKEDFRKSCKKKGYNGVCSAWAFREICVDNYANKKPDPYARCDLYSYIPKLQCYHKKRCAHYKVDSYCVRHRNKCRKECKYVEVKAQDLYVPHNAVNVPKGKPDPYAPPKVFKKVCYKKCHKICSEFAKRSLCDRYDNVKFCKKTGYIQYCAQPVSGDSYVPKPDTYNPQPCKNKKKIKYCIRWKKEKQCDEYRKVRVCLKRKTLYYCAAYKSTPFCTQYENIPKRCVKKRHTKTCVKKSEGQRVCCKYALEGGKQVCHAKASITKCAKFETVCSKVQEDNNDTIHDSKKVSHKKVSPPAKKH